MYLLKNKFGKIYVGFSADLANRLKEHNYGMTKSTKSGRPWNLVYCESYKSQEDARTREATLKHYGSTLGHLKKRIKNSLNI